MKDQQIFVIAKLKSSIKLKKAAIHNHREMDDVPFNIDATKMHLNYILEGPKNVCEVMSLDRALKEEAGVAKGRKDRVQALEIMFSLPIDTAINHRAYFSDCLSWTKAQFKCPILSVVVHLDEVAPHCHVLLLPLVNGKMNGSDLMGNAPKLRARHMDFNEQVGKRYGLKHSGKPKKLSAEQRSATTKLIYEKVVQDREVLTQPGFKALLQHTISLNLEKWATAVKVRLPSAGTFVGIMTKPVRPM